MKNEYRIEKDALGSVEVPKDVLYGAQTIRALQNFPITGSKTHPYMIRALGMVKKACAIANQTTHQLSEEQAKYIIAACDEVIENRLDPYFITDKIQGGAGTSVNMNANEVIANRAAQLANRKIGVYDFIHPNDHVNCSQSTNDVYPTAAKIASLLLVTKLVAEIKALNQSILFKSEAFDDVIKVGRTHLQDAVPIRLGQEFHAYYSAFKRDIKRIQIAFDSLLQVNIGATAIGTGINADAKFKSICIAHLRKISGMHLVSNKDLIDGTRNVDCFVYAHNALKTFAVNLSKMCNDLRLMASGPRAGFAEIILPAKQPGSSIMPGKVNPVIPEVCNQVCFEVFGNDVTIMTAAEAGQMELNVFEPVIFLNLFQSMEILTNAVYALRVHAINGLEANRDVCQERVEQSLGLATALAPHLGYTHTSKLAKQALQENKKLKDMVLDHNLMQKQTLDDVLNIYAMTQPRSVVKK